MNIFFKFSLSFLTFGLLFGCGNQKSTTELVGVMVDTTQTEGWDVEEASFGEEFANETKKKAVAFENKSEFIKTILLYVGNSEMNAPITTLGADNQITLSFDVLQNDRLNLSYRIVHCDARWNKSDIFESDFISGMNNTPITQVLNSFNTQVSYQNYRAEIPGENNEILLAGNYVVQVFNTNQPDDFLFQAPFYVVDQQVTIKPSIVSPKINEARRYMQNIHFTIQHPTIEITNPFQDVYVVVKQNQQDYLSIEGLNPMYIKNKELVYEYDEPTYFEGGNEFRFFDLKSMNYQTPEIASMSFDGKMNHAHLAVSNKRTFSVYSSQADINGRFLIKNDDGQDANTDADYVMTHFQLNFDFDLPNGTVYVAGGLSNNRLLPKFALTYNRDKKVYEADVLLKQGYYNYMYVTKFEETNKTEVSYVEGSHDETENDYSIMVYLRDRNMNTHRLIGYQRFNSVK
jgi:hypothetical protein